VPDEHSLMRRKRRQLTPEQKWEVFLEVTTGELTQADAARKWGVDVWVVIKLRKLARDAVLAAFAACQPGRSLDPRDAALAELRRENDRLSDALTELAIKLALVRGKPRWTSSCAPGARARVQRGQTGSAQAHRRRRRGRLGAPARDRDAGRGRCQGASLARPAARGRHAGRPRVGRQPSALAAGLTGAAILDLIEEWGPVDHSHRKLAHRGSWLGRVWVSPSSVRRVADKHQVSLPEQQPRRPQVAPPWPDWVS
jgi:transposase